VQQVAIFLSLRSGLCAIEQSVLLHVPDQSTSVLNSSDQPLRCIVISADYPPNYSCLMAMVYVGRGVACFAAQLYPAYRTSTALSLLDLVVLLDCEAIPFEPFTSSLPWI